MEAQTTLRNLPIGKPELQDAYRATLKGFYGALKSMDGCIKFALLTGIRIGINFDSAASRHLWAR